MLSGTIEGFLRTLTPGQVTDVFLILIVAVFVTAFLAAARAKHSQFLDHAPSLMTALGILGTFVGIVIGLLDFDPRDIDSSIGSLLEGLKTAFTTSLSGMTASIVFKAIDSWLFAPLRNRKDTKQDVTPRDIYRSMRENNEILAELKNSIAGAEEGSLVGQTKLLRSDISDFRSETARTREEFNKRLWNELENFADMLSRSATEQVIEALRQVIVEFNQKLTEQFGDNFKRLDESVKRLVDWQAQYMQQMTEMSDHYAEGVKAIDSTREAVGDISERAEEIPKSMDRLRDVLEVNQHQIAELQRHLDAFVQMRDKAVDAVPQIKEQITSIGSQLTEGAEGMKLVLLEGAANFKDSVTQTSAAMNNMATTVAGESEQIASTLKDVSDDLSATGRDMIERIGNGAEAMQRQMDETIESAMSGIRQNAQTMLTGVEQTITNTLGDTRDAVNEQMRVLDQALQNELNRAMEDLGKALATIAKHIVDTYEEHTGPRYAEGRG